MSNTPNVSRDSFDYSKFYETTVLQQGVPVLDSDWNEQADIAAMRHLADRYSLFGNGLYPPRGSAPGTRGYEVQGIPATIANAKITAGYASVYGSAIPSTPAQVPLDFNYEDDSNFLTDGAVSSTSGGDTIVDDNKKFEAWLDLVGCRIKMTSGVSSGVEFEITNVPNQTSLECSGGIGSAIAGDTYIIKPQALPASVVAQTLREFQVWVWWEWINENEDPNIVNPGVAIETCERRVRRWCVRASDTPYVGTPDLWTFSLRVLPIASVTIEPGDTILFPITDDIIFIDPTLPWTKPFTQVRMVPKTLVTDTLVVLPKYLDVDAQDPLYYYVGIGSTKESYRGFYELLDGSDPEKLRPLITSDGFHITVESMWINNLVEVTDPSAQASSEGFMENAGDDMVLRLNFPTLSTDTTFTGGLIVRCHHRATLTQQDPSNLPENGVTRGLHADAVQQSALSLYNVVNGAEFSSSAEDVEAWLRTVGEGLASRPATFPSTQALTENEWKLLFRTGTHLNTNQGPIDIWFNNVGENIKTQSCIPINVSPATVLRVNASSSVSGTLDASVDGWLLDQAGQHILHIRATKWNVIHNEELDPQDESDWDLWEMDSRSLQKRYSSGTSWSIESILTVVGNLFCSSNVNIAGDLEFAPSFGGIKDLRSPGTDRTLLYEWQGNEWGSFRLYLKGTSSSQHTSYFEIASNCFWDKDTSQWVFNGEGTANEATEATLYRFAPTRFDIFYQNSAHIAGSRWDDHTNPPTGWQTDVSPTVFTSSGQVGPKTAGDSQESRRIALASQNTGSGPSTVYAADSVNYGNNYQRDVIDAGSSITLSVDSAGQWSAIPTVNSINFQGFTVSGFSDTVNAGSLAYWYGTATIDIEAS